MMEYPEKPGALARDFQEVDGTVKTHAWLKNDDFVVIPKKYFRGQRRLITSFWKEQGNTKR